MRLSEAEIGRVGAAIRRGAKRSGSWRDYALSAIAEYEAILAEKRAFAGADPETEDGEEKSG